jgi:3-methyladenine DNA glycosylase AlkD
MSLPSLAKIRRRLRELASPSDAAHLQRFFKTGAGEYGAGDRFLGVRVPGLRRLAREFHGLSLPETERLLRSKFHEERLLALLILVGAYRRADEAGRGKIYRLYLQNAAFVNNWDLVDSSAPYIVGPHLIGRSRKILHKMVRSKNLWERRIAVLATFHFIRAKDFADLLLLAEVLLGDAHDLIHKAVGWMLRETGNRDTVVLRGFLERHSHRMPRTMLRYAIEKLPERERKAWLRREVGKALEVV